MRLCELPEGLGRTPLYALFEWDDTSEHDPARSHQRGSWLSTRNPRADPVYSRTRQRIT